ncbi:MAG: hypothetical protein K0S00_2214 [Xanthobacteraceae bacterium]|jgi:hypothetical protein|nr:hypothetical protein [Xanthobacteraceae bacterium]
MMDVLSGFGGFGVPLLAFAGLVVLAILVIFIGRRARRHRGHGLVAGHRLAVVDQVTIDDHRRLVLIQRDDVQHLVILGGGSDFLVESGIGAAQLRPAAEEPRRTVHETVPTPAVRRPAPQPAPIAPPAGEPRAPDPRAPEARAPEARPYEPPVRPNEPAARPIPAPLASRRPPAGPTDEPVAVLPPVPLRTEPAIETASPAPVTEPGPRTAVKVDPAFAGMAEELEEVLRRPAADLPPRRTPGSLASAPINPAAERAVPPVTPPAPPSRGPAAAEPVNAPAPAPAAPPPVAPEPRIIPTRSEAAPEIRAPEVRPTEPLIEASETDKVSDDPFEQEMANLLGRAKRP